MYDTKIEPLKAFVYVCILSVSLMALFGDLSLAGWIVDMFAFIGILKLIPKDDDNNEQPSWVE